MKNFKKRFLKPACIALAAACVSISSMSYAQPWQGKGRIAVSSDGNQHDSDDWAATAMTLAIIGNRELQDRLVHYDYADHVWNTNNLFETNVEESALGAAQRFGFDRSRFFNSFRNQNAAVNSIKNAVNASSANNPLFFIVAGPMEVPYQGIRAANPNKRRFVNMISHSLWNDHHGDCDDGRDWTECHPGSHHKPDIEALGVNWIAISDQNEGNGKRKFHTGNMGAWSFLNRLNGKYDAAYEWTYTRIDLAYTPGDASDAGMAYYLFTGDQNGDTGKLERFMKTPAGGGNGPAPTPVPTPFPTPTGNPMVDQCDTTAQCRVTYGNTATDCRDSRSNRSVCMCGSSRCDAAQPTATPVPTATPAPTPVPTPFPTPTSNPTVDQCDTTAQCKATFGNRATDCLNSQSNRSVCMCGSSACQ